MKRKRYYYKVVQKYDGFYGSAFIGGQARVKYYINCWTSAPEYLAEKGFHLVVFSTKVVAIDWVRRKFNMQDYEVFKCEVLGKADFIPPFFNGSYLPKDFLNNVDYWRRYKQFDKSSNIKWPTGSCFFKKIKLVKRVWPV